MSTEDAIALARELGTPRLARLDAATVAKARDHARALAHHERGSGKRRVSRYSRLSNPTAADPARGSFTPSRKSRKRRG